MRTIVFLALMAGCGGEPEAPASASVAGPHVASAASPLVAKAAAIAIDVRKEPGRAEAIFADHGTDRAEFESILYDIAADPALSADYANATR